MHARRHSVVSSVKISAVRSISHWRRGHGVTS